MSRPLILVYEFLNARIVVEKYDSIDFQSNISYLISTISTLTHNFSLCSIVYFGKSFFLLLRFVALEQRCSLSFSLLLDSFGSRVIQGVTKILDGPFDVAASLCVYDVCVFCV